MLPSEKTIQNKKQLKEWLDYEKKRYCVSNRPKDIFLTLTKSSENHILYALQRLLRKVEYYKNTGKNIRFAISKTLLLRKQNKYAIHIPINACGKGFRVMHVGPVLINKKVTFGENCSVHINTSFVAGGTNDDVPQIGNCVVVVVGAVVLGPVKIADCVAIGANAVVNKDVLEENVAVAGVPAKVISQNGTKEWNKRAKEAK